MAPELRPLMCDGWCKRTGAVSHIDEKGFAYCAPCGQKRKESGIRCRRLAVYELRKLQAGERLPSYEGIPLRRGADELAADEAEHRSETRAWLGSEARR